MITHLSEVPNKKQWIKFMAGLAITYTAIAVTGFYLLKDTKPNMNQSNQTPTNIEQITPQIPQNNYETFNIENLYIMNNKDTITNTNSNTKDTILNNKDTINYKLDKF